MIANKRLLAMVPEARGFILRKVLASWVSLLAGIVLWLAAAELLDRAFHGERGGAALFAAALVCIAVRFWLVRVNAGLTHQAVACVKLRLRRAIYDKLRRLGAGYAAAFPTAEVVQLAGEGVEQLESYFGNYLPQLFYALLAPVTLLLVFWQMSPLTAAALFLCVPLIPVMIVAVQRVAKRLLGKYWDAYASLGDSFLENLQGLTTLKVYGADGARHQAMNEEAERFRRITMKVLTMQLNSVTVMDLVAYGGTALGGILSARAFGLGQVTFGQAIAMILLASEFFLAMRALGSYFHVAMNGMAASDRMFRLLDLPEPPEGKEQVKGSGIRARDLSFSYDGEKDALSHMELEIPAGSLVSICGESGCGKSTLAALISGVCSGYRGPSEAGGRGGEPRGQGQPAQGGDGGLLQRLSVRRHGPPDPEGGPEGCGGGADGGGPAPGEAAGLRQESRGAGYAPGGAGGQPVRRPAPAAGAGPGAAEGQPGLYL